MILLYEIGAGKEGEIMGLLEGLLGVAGFIGSVVATGGKSAANDSNCSDSDRQLGREIQKSSENFVNTINKMQNRINAYYDD